MGGVICEGQEISAVCNELKRLRLELSNLKQAVINYLYGTQMTSAFSDESRKELEDLIHPITNNKG